MTARCPKCWTRFRSSVEAMVHHCAPTPVEKPKRAARPPRQPRQPAVVAPKFQGRTTLRVTDEMADSGRIMHDIIGMSWHEIGRHLGVARSSIQAAAMRRSPFTYKQEAA